MKRLWVIFGALLILVGIIYYWTQTFMPSSYGTPFLVYMTFIALLGVVFAIYGFIAKPKAPSGR